MKTVREKRCVRFLKGGIVYFLVVSIERRQGFSSLLLVEAPFPAGVGFDYLNAFLYPLANVCCMG